MAFPNRTKTKAKKVATLTSILITTVTILLLLLYANFYKDSTTEFQNLYFAIGASVIGVLLHFLKKLKWIQKRFVLTAESMELLMLAAAPTFVSYTIIGEGPDSLSTKLLITLIVFFSWYSYNIINLTRSANLVDGRNAFSSTIALFFSILSTIVFGFLVIIFVI